MATKLKLHQLLALLKTVKPNSYNKLTELHRDAQKKEQLNGFDKTFNKKNEEDLDRAPEHKPVLLNANDILKEWSEVSTRWYDMAATHELANTMAKADVVVGTEVIVKDAPVGFLMFLDKQLDDLENTLEKIVTLDPAIKWSYNSNDGLYQSEEPTKTIATKKVPKNHVKAPATDKHPAQVEIFTEDVQAGVWTRVERSGALPGDRQRALLARTRELILAVRKAREEANALEVNDVKVGEKIFGYLFK